jgi:hypothetical protein
MRNGRRLISHEWIAEHRAKVGDRVADRGYGYLWWTKRPSAGRYPGSTPSLTMEADRRSTRAVIPSDDLVIVHRGDTDHGRNIRAEMPGASLS